MKPHASFIGIIPARYGSSRLPGKPLLEIGGVPMVVRVARRAAEALERVVVATDDTRIADVCAQSGIEAVMTSATHRSGTDRCLEAYRRTGSTASVVVNIQGDEPFVAPSQVIALKQIFADNPTTQIATLVRRYDPASGWDRLADPNLVKAVLSERGEALWFSRSVIPYVRGAGKEQWPAETEYFTHVGMYAYRSDILEAVTSLPPSSAETAESLEQLRWLQAGYTISTAITDTATVGIDTPDDLRRAQLLCQ